MHNGTMVTRTHPLQALAFLYARSTANRFRAQLQKARSPRYLAAIVMGMLYLWWAFFRNSRALPTGAWTQGGTVPPLVAVLLMAVAARWWLFGADRSTLAFTPAELQFLFPAPVSRRTLVHAKLLRLQLGILLNTAIFSVLLRGQAGSWSGWRRGLALWVLFSVFALHRLAVAMLRASVAEHDRAGWRRSLLPMLVLAVPLTAVAWTLFAERAALLAAYGQGLGATVSAANVALTRPMAAIALWPAQALLRPLFATNAATWVAALPAPLVLLLLHYAAVMRTDTAFEEAALEATQFRVERLQRARAGNLGSMGWFGRGKSTVARVPRLALHGQPAVAIAWKNVAAAMRGGAWRLQVILYSVILVMMAVVLRTSGNRDTADAFTAMTAILGGMLLFLGPVSMRYDLRLDLPRLAILKTWPLPGRQIVAAEMAGAALLHTITMWCVLLVPVTVATLEPKLWDPERMDVPVLLAVALGIPFVNALLFTIQNATALMFPAWVRLGTDGRGFETMGQNLLTMGATSLAAAIALVFPVGVAALVLLLGRSWHGWVLPVAVAAGSAVIVVEIWAAMVGLGEVFEKTELSDLR